MRWVRLGVMVLFAAGITFAAIAGPSFAARVNGQTGYGAPQDLGEQVINPKNASDNNMAFWIGLLVAAGVIGATGFIGWRKTHQSEPY